MGFHPEKLWTDHELWEFTTASSKRVIEVAVDDENREKRLEIVQCTDEIPENLDEHWQLAIDPTTSHWVSEAKVLRGC
jgi:hypothetical protein